MTNTGMVRIHQCSGNVPFPNLWISPYEASALYSQKGLPELIINKKSKSIFLNGIKIKKCKTEKWTARQREPEHGKARNSEGYFRRSAGFSCVRRGSCLPAVQERHTDNHSFCPSIRCLKPGFLQRTALIILYLLTVGIRMHLPFINPTHRDYLNPEKYFIPYLGADLHGSRASRIVTGSQAGWLGQVATYGWGLSDFCGS